MGCTEPPEVDARSHGGYTPLHIAAMNSRYEVIELLVVVYKADPDVTDFAGRKPIYYLEHEAPPSQRSSSLLRRFVRQIATRNSYFRAFNYFTLSAGRAEDQLLGSYEIATFLKIRSTLFLHGVCMLRDYGECAHEQHVRRTLSLTLTLTHTITAYPVS